MFVLLTYDIDQSDGGKRLRRVAKSCEGYGIRVQNSVFELNTHESDLKRLIHELQEIIDTDLDSVRIYRCGKVKKDDVEILGKREAVEISKDDAFFL